MKILFVINTLSYPGGAERVLSTLANHLCDIHDVYIITSWQTDHEYYLNSKVKRFSIYENRPTISKLHKNIRSINYIRKFVKHHKIDTTISFCTENNVRMLLALLGINNNKIISIRNDPKYELSNLALKLINYVLYFSVDKIVFQTEEARCFFPSFIRKKGIIIHNPVSELFYSKSNKQRKNKLITYGRITEQKNHKLLIDAFESIKDKTDYNLEIYGNGSLEKTIHNYIIQKHLDDRVFLFSKTENVKLILDDSEIFVLSSNFEGLPNALMEALASGIACISTDCPCGGPAELIRNGYNGILVPLDSVDDMANAIIDLINDKEKRKRFKKNAEIMSEEFHIKNILKKWEKIL